jgi:hypothetical protein
MRVVKWRLLVVALIAAASTGRIVPARQTTLDDRAQKILREARGAIGGESKLKSVNGASATWKFTRVAAGGGQDTGDLRYDFSLPGRFEKKEVVNLSGNLGQVTTVSALNGERASSDVRSSSNEVPVVNASPDKTDEAAVRQRLQKEFASYLLELLLTAPPSAPVAIAYVGEAEAEDGRADVLEATGGNNFSMHLFFDKETHLLRLVSYREPARRRFAAPSSKSAGNLLLQKRTNEVAAANVEVQLRFSEFRAEGGILVPHRITRERDGKIDMEMELKDFQVNPSFKPRHFDGKQ